MSWQTLHFKSFKSNLKEKVFVRHVLNVTTSSNVTLWSKILMWQDSTTAAQWIVEPTSGLTWNGHIILNAMFHKWNADKCHPLDAETKFMSGARWWSYKFLRTLLPERNGTFQKGVLRESSPRRGEMQWFIPYLLTRKCDAFVAGKFIKRRNILEGLYHFIFQVVARCKFNLI